MSKLKIPYLEFYITNVCNLSCPGCNRFNNYQFRGVQRWLDYQDIYRRWAEELQPGSIGILGGEPLLNPDAMAWIQGIHDLWPNKFCKIVTNGFYLNRVKELYDFLRENKNVEIWLGIHNKMNKPRMMQIIKDFLVGPLHYELDDSNKYQQFVNVVDSNQVKIRVEHNWWFHQGALIKDVEGFRLHNSDVEKAHEICHMKTCHHFIRGKLYKCGVVALLPEFDQQHVLHLDDQDRNLINSYRPLEIDHDHETKSKFISGLSNSIPQCKFCPEIYHGDQIFALEKKK